MEKKRELILVILKKLRGFWDLADNMITLVESEYCSEELIDALIGLLNNLVKNLDKTQSNEDQLSLKNTLEALEAIQKLKLEK